MYNIVFTIYLYILYIYYYIPMNNSIQWNCHGLRANINDFRLLCDNYNPIVWCIQETMLTKDDFIIQGFNCIHSTSRDIGGRACGGVSVLVRDGIPSSECTFNTSLRVKAVTISTSKTITICSLYLPPRENLNIVLLSRLIDNCLPHLLFVVTLMAIAYLGAVTRIIVSEIELTILLQITIFVYLMMVLTYFYPVTGTFTAIDLSLCSPDILMEINFMVEPDSYIILKIGVLLPDALPRWNLNQADLVKFDNVCN